MNALREGKYSTWEWNFGYKKEFSFHKDSYFSGGLLDVRMDIAQDRIAEVRIFGDYFGRRDVAEAEDALRGKPYSPGEVRACLESLPIGEYFSGISIDELVSAFF